MRFFKIFSLALIVFIFIPLATFAKGDLQDYALDKGIDTDKIIDFNSALDAYNKAKAVVASSPTELNNALVAEMGTAVIFFATGKMGNILSESNTAVSQANTADKSKGTAAINLVKTKAKEASDYLPTVKKYFNETKTYINKILNAPDPSIKSAASKYEEDISNNYKYAQSSEVDCKNNIKKAETSHKQAIEDAAKRATEEDTAKRATEEAERKATEKAGNQAFGSGNITCGNRSFNCQRGGWFAGVSDECYCCGSCTPDDLLTVGNTILQWLFGIIGAIGLAMFVWGGFKWVTSAGNPSSVTEGKTVMVNTIIGLVIMFSAGAVVMRIQSSLNIDSATQISISKEGPSFATSSSSSSATNETEKHGNTKIGESCLYNLNTKDSECGEGLYCYSIDQTKGVCLPSNPEKTVDSGGDCYVLPGDGSKDMCKTGTCQAESKTPGTKGVCPANPDSATTGTATTDGKCKKDADCPKDLFGSGISVTCHTKSGKCLPKTGRNKDLDESCYVISGSASDCRSGLLCITNPNASDPKVGRNVGDEGVCARYAVVNPHESCRVDYECKNFSTKYTCLDTENSSGEEYGSYCVLKNATAGGGLKESCDKVSDVRSTCLSSFSCYQPSSAKTGICIPAAGRDKKYKESCFILQNSLSNDCYGAMKCIVNVNNPTNKTSPGQEGVCYYDKFLESGADCLYSFECVSSKCTNNKCQ